jgi:hypothetical protein
MNYLTNVVFNKDEGNLVEHHVRIHHYLGVEKTIIYDRSTIAPLPEDIFRGRDDVEVIKYPTDDNHNQRLCFRDACQYLSGKSHWVIFNDIDEVHVPIKTNDLRVALQAYEQYSSVGWNWKCVGSNGYEQEPDEPYLAFSRRARDEHYNNRHIKSILKPDRCQYVMWENPHVAILQQGNYQVNDRMQLMVGPFNFPATYDNGAVYHYFTRSKEWWMKKISRVRADTNTPGSEIYSAEQFDREQKELNEIEDYTVANIRRKMIKEGK